MRWNVRNISRSDIPLKIKTWSGQIIEDVFHAGEIVSVNDEGYAALRRLNMEECFFVESICEDASVNWKKEGF